MEFPKCLLIDDNHEYLETISAGLALHNIVNVTKLSDSMMALDCLCEHHLQGSPFDIVITDNFMLELNGHDLMVKCRMNPQLQKIPFIIMTGDPENMPAKECFTGDAVADEYIIKPFNIVHLVRKIEAIYTLSKNDQKGFCPIRVSTLFVDKKIPFDVFLNHYDQFRLLIKKDDLLTEKHLETLRTHSTKTLFISSGAEEQYQLYLESNLQNSFLNLKRTAVEHAEIITEYGISVLRSEFDNPTALNFAHLGKITSGLNGFLNKDELKRVSSLFKVEGEIDIQQKSLNVAAICLLLANKISLWENSKKNSEFITPFMGLFEQNSRSLKILIESALMHRIGYDDTISAEQNFDQILSTVKSIPNVDPKVIDIIEQQNELFDGSGYPNGLSRTKMGVFAQVLSFAKELECQLSQSSGDFTALKKHFYYNRKKFNPKLYDILKLIFL